MSRPLFAGGGGGLGGLTHVGPVTKWLCGITLAASVVFGFLGRSGHFGIQDLVFSVPALLDLQLWRLATFPFVVPDPFGLIFGLVVLWLFGGQLELRWGSKEFLRFFLVSSYGAALLTIPLYFLINLALPMADPGMAYGPNAALDAMLVALALLMPESSILFGFALPINVRTLVWLLLGFQLISGLMTGVANLAITLGGMLMGWLLVTGNWRPRRLLAWLETFLRRRRRKGFRVVGRDDGPTLH